MVQVNIERKGETIRAHFPSPMPSEDLLLLLLRLGNDIPYVMAGAEEAHAFFIRIPQDAGLDRATRMGLLLEAEHKLFALVGTLGYTPVLTGAAT